MEFHLQYPDKPGPSCKLMEWLEVWKSGQHTYDELDDNTPMSPSPRTSCFRESGGVLSE